MPLIISDFLDFSIYIDAEEPSLRTWYTDRFLSLRQAALNNEEDFFNRFSSINDDQAKEEIRNEYKKMADAIKGFEESVGRFKKEVDDLWKGLDAASSPLG